MLLRSVIKFVYKVCYNTWLLLCLQIRHQHVNIEVLALEETKKATLIARITVTDGDYCGRFQLRRAL